MAQGEKRESYREHLGGLLEHLQLASDHGQHRRPVMRVSTETQTQGGDMTVRCMHLKLEGPVPRLLNTWAHSLDRLVPRDLGLDHVLLHLGVLVDVVVCLDQQRDIAQPPTVNTWHHRKCRENMANGESSRLDLDVPSAAPSFAVRVVRSFSMSMAFCDAGSPIFSCFSCRAGQQRERQSQSAH